MSNFFEKIGSLIISTALIVGGWFGVEAPQQNFGASTSSSDVIALFETTLASRITDTATTLTLTSATDKDGNTLASSTYGLIIDEGTAVEELVLADCTGTACTNLTRGLSVRTGTTTVTALRKEHRRGASVKITDAPSLIFATNVFRGRQNVEKLMNYDSDLSIASTSRAIPYASWVIGQTNTASTSVKSYADSTFGTIGTTQTISGDKTFSGSNIFSQSLILTSGFTASASSTAEKGIMVTTPYRCTVNSDNNQLCEKAYIDGVVVAGASDANETTKGIVELATGVEAASSTSIGATGARLVLPSSIATSTYNSATANLKVVMTQNNGKIDNNFIDYTPPGSIIAYSSTTAPTGWLLADGTAVSRITYASLYSVIGVYYGAGDGSTTFNLPNLTGRTIVMASSTQTSTSTTDGTPNTRSVLGYKGGETMHTMTENELAAHTHSETINASSGGTASGSAFAGTAGGTTGSTGNSVPFNVLDPYIILNYIIKY